MADRAVGKVFIFSYPPPCFAKQNNEPVNRCNLQEELFIPRGFPESLVENAQTSIWIME